MNLIQSICCFVSRRCGSKAAPKKAARRKLKRAIMVLAHGGLVFHPRFDLPQVVQSVMPVFRFHGESVCLLIQSPGIFGAVPVTRDGFLFAQSKCQ